MSQATGDALQAGREAFERNSWEQAFEALSAADGEESLAGEDLERLAEAARWSRHYEEMLDAYERAVAVHERGGDRRGAARAALKLVVEHYQRRDDALAAGSMGRAAKLVEGEGDCHERGVLMWCQASGLSAQGDIEGARQAAEEVVRIGREIGDRDLEALGIVQQGHAALVDGDIERGVALIDEGAAAAMSGDLELWATGQVLCTTIFACRNRGDWRRAGEWSDASLRWCHRHSLSFFPGLCRFHGAEVLRFRGRLAEAEEAAAEATDELLASAPRFAAWALHELGEIRRRRGDLEGAAESFARSTELGFDAQPGLGLLRLDQGKPDAARRAVEPALADADGLAQEGRPLLLPAVVTIAIAAGDGELAQRAVEELDSHAKALGTSAVGASARVARGELALAAGNSEEAAELLRAGSKGWTEVDAPYEAAGARALLAEALRGLGDPEAAEVELEAARATFKRIGAPREAERVAAALAPSEAPAARAARTFLFSDIVDSTKLVELLGDEAWESLLAWHDRSLRSCFEASGGEEVKHEGDGFFVAFGDAATAIECSRKIQSLLAEHRREHGFAPSVRIGVHTTEATDRGGDYGGRGVHVAARVMAAAGAGEVLASRETVEAAGESVPASGERTIEAKGLAAPLAVVSVDWSDGAG